MAGKKKEGESGKSFSDEWKRWNRQKAEGVHVAGGWVGRVVDEMQQNLLVLVVMVVVPVPGDQHVINDY